MVGRGFTGAESEEVREDGGKSVAMLPRMGTDWAGEFVCPLRIESAAQAWESFALISLSLLPGFVTALSDPKLGRGAVPCPAAQLQSCPAVYCPTSR
jgi:hypothetical protein